MKFRNKKSTGDFRLFFIRFGYGKWWKLRQRLGGWKRSWMLWGKNKQIRSGWVVSSGLCRFIFDISSWEIGIIFSMVEEDGSNSEGSFDSILKRNDESYFSLHVSPSLCFVNKYFQSNFKSIIYGSEWNDVQNNGKTF